MLNPKNTFAWWNGHIIITLVCIIASYFYPTLAWPALILASYFVTRLGVDKDA